MILSIVATVFIILAILLTVFVALCTKFYTARVPSGPDAMALATPAIAFGLLWICVLVATWLCLAHGGLDWIAPSPGAGMISTGAVVGLFVASGGGFLLWSDKKGRFKTSGGLALAFVLPLVVNGFVLACAWGTREGLAAAGWTRPFGFGLAPFAAAGLGVGGWALVAQQKRRYKYLSGLRAADDAIYAKAMHRQALPRAEQVAMDLGEMSADSPLWTIICLLPGETDEAARRVVLERGKLVPNLDEHVTGCLGSEHALYRMGAVEFILLLGTPKECWMKAVAACFEVTAASIRKRKSLEGEDNVNFAAHTKILLNAAELYLLQSPGAEGVSFVAGTRSIRGAVETVPESADRAGLLASLDAFLAAHPSGG